MTDYNTFTVAQFADTLAAKLSAYYAQADRAADPFFYFEGQDPFAFTAPSGAIARLYRSVSPDAQERLSQALLDVIGTRINGNHAAALEQLVLTVGSLQRRAHLIPLVKQIGMLAADRSERRSLFVAALMVLKGFGYQSEVVEAAKVISGFSDFPADLIYDVIELRTADHKVNWATVVQELSPHLLGDKTLTTAERAEKRIAHLAEWLSKHVSFTDLQIGVDILLADDGSGFARRALAARSDVVALLVRGLKRSNRNLVLRPDPPEKDDSAMGFLAPHAME